MSGSTKKPKLLFFQYKYGKKLPEFLLVHKNEHVECLAEFFDVVVVNEDCDYAQICDLHQPDMALFEGGVTTASCRRPAVTNISSRPQVLKAGLLYADAFSEGRNGFLSDMDHWGVETFFATPVTAPEHTPSIARNLFVWPNFVNPNLYRDYGQTKNIPVLFTGSKNTLYPWRQQVLRLVSQQYPSLICPHPGYRPQKTAAASVMVGEAYARMLNASWFVPACGTVAREVVRKHFEIPACNACLVTESSAALEAAGFVDMQNCVFADEKNILDKLNYLFERQEELLRISKAGFDLVHQRHTLRQRDQILQWFRLSKTLGSNQRIVQQNPFGALEVVEKDSSRESLHVRSEGQFVTLLREGDHYLHEGEYKAAQDRYLQCLSYYRYMPEPLLGLAVCSLFEGRPEAALKWITQPITATLADYKAVDPDPVEWAYYVITLLCLGRIDEARSRSAEYPWLRHPELDRIRWIISVLDDSRPRVAFATSAKHARLSVHSMPLLPFHLWVERLCTLLEACGQQETRELIPARCTSVQSSRSEKVEPGSDTLLTTVDHAKLRTHWSNALPFILLRRDASATFQRSRFYSDSWLRAKGIIKALIHGVEKNLGHFLPRKLSSSHKEDELIRTIRSVIAEEELRVALWIGDVQDEAQTVLTGAVAGGRKLHSVFCGVGSAGALPASELHGLTWVELDRADVSERLDVALGNAKQSASSDSFDLVVIAAKQQLTIPTAPALLREIQAARLIVLIGIHDSYIQTAYACLLSSVSHRIVEQDATVRGGYVIFQRAGECTELKADDFNEVHA